LRQVLLDGLSTMQSFAASVDGIWGGLGHPTNTQSFSTFRPDRQATTGGRFFDLGTAARFLTPSARGV
jgi:hypothetical protein